MNGWELVPGGPIRSIRISGYQAASSYDSAYRSRAIPKSVETYLRSFREVSVEGGASAESGLDENSVGEIALIREIISAGKTGFTASSDNRFIKLHISGGMLTSGSVCSSVIVVTYSEIWGLIICDEESLASDVASSESDSCCPGGPKTIAGFV